MIDWQNLNVASVALLRREGVNRRNALSVGQQEHLKRFKKSKRRY